MVKSQLIELASKVNTDSEKTLFVSSFDDYTDTEIVAIFAAWLSDGTQESDYALHNLIDGIMGGEPKEFFNNFLYKKKALAKGGECFYKMFTYDALLNLCNRIYENFNLGSLQDQIEVKMGQPGQSCTYAHDAFAKLLGGSTMFPTTSSNGTFYRYNLLHYWLTFKLRVWYNVVYDDMALLPCNDKVFDNAYKRGVTNKRLKTNLNSAIELTDIAKRTFGEKYYYKMFELLNFHHD